jgi:hypothetical protein
MWPRRTDVAVLRVPAPGRALRVPLMPADELPCPPLYGTARSPERPTLGPRVAEIAAKLGKPPMPHQRHIYDVAYEIDPKTGYLAYSEVVMIGPRQASGKSELLFPAMTHRCTGFTRALSDWVRAELGHDVKEPGPQRVLYTAQRAEDARQKWRDVHVERLRGSVFKSKIDVRLRLAAEQIAWPNGSTWSPGAATKRAGGTGDTLDMAIIDEGWSRDDFSTELGLKPAMLTRPWSQFWVTSMIPGISRSLPGTWPYLYAKRQNGRARVQAGNRRGMAYFEFGARPDADPGDENTWWSAMPGLGITVPVSRIAQDYESMAAAGQLTDFCAEYLGWVPEATAARWAVVSEATWIALAVPAHRGVFQEPVAFGVDASPDQSAASIGMAAKTPIGDTFVELIERRPGLSWTIPALVKLTQQHGPCAIGIAAHGPAAPIIEPLRRALLEANVDAPISTERSIVKTFQGPDVSKACRQFYLETGEVGEVDNEDPSFDVNRRIVHIDQPELNAAVAGAAKYTFSDEWRWQRSGEGGDASPLYAVTLARTAGETVEWIGGSYNVADSLG